MCVCMESLAAEPIAAFRNLPPAADPLAVGNRLAERFLKTPPERQQPKGYDGKKSNEYVPYAVCSFWINALDFARTTGNDALSKRLTDIWEPFYGPKKWMWSAPYHVDFTIFGAVPYAIYLANGDKRALEIGNSYADAQWAEPGLDDTSKLPKFVQGPEHNLPYRRQVEFWKRGYTPQTRLWIDDMYMITVLQTHAYRATGNGVYLARAAEEAILYLDQLQLKDGPCAGLFYHAPDVPFVWGRGDGWMAGGMPLILKHLPANDPLYAPILAGYRRMMAALLRHQRADGLWGQLVDDPKSWSETSGSAMFTYAFIMGVKNGWLDPDAYGPAARRAWLALVGKLDPEANLTEVCIGTGKKNDHQYYLDRKRLVGDAHGQAPMMWCVNALLEPPKDEAACAARRIRRAPVAILTDALDCTWRQPQGSRCAAPFLKADGTPFDGGDWFVAGVLEMFRDGKYGDGVDVLLSTVPVEVMNRYHVLVVGGNLRPSIEMEENIKAYVRDGGHVVLTGGNAEKWNRATDDFSGKGRATRLETPWGLYSKPQCALPVKCEDGKLPPSPYPLLSETRALLDGIFREAAARPPRPLVPANPPPDPVGCFLALRGMEPMAEQVGKRPTFYRHFSGVVVPARYVAIRDAAVLAEERQWAAKAGLKVLVDASACQQACEKLKAKVEALGAVALTAADRENGSLARLHAKDKAVDAAVAGKKGGIWFVAASMADPVTGRAYAFDCPVVRRPEAEHIAYRAAVKSLAANGATLVFDAAYADTEEEFRELHLLDR